MCFCFFHAKVLLYTHISALCCIKKKLFLLKTKKKGGNCLVESKKCYTFAHAIRKRVVW